MAPDVSTWMEMSNGAVLASSEHRYRRPARNAAFHAAIDESMPIRREVSGRTPAVCSQPTTAAVLSSGRLHAATPARTATKTTIAVTSLAHRPSPEERVAEYA